MGIKILYACVGIMLLCMSCVGMWGCTTYIDSEPGQGGIGVICLGLIVMGFTCLNRFADA